jgi:hypothetical protein
MKLADKILALLSREANGALLEGDCRRAVRP